MQPLDACLVIEQSKQWLGFLKWNIIDRLVQSLVTNASGDSMVSSGIPSSVLPVVFLVCGVLIIFVI